MRFSSHIRRTVTFSLLLVFIIGFALSGYGSLTTYAIGTTSNKPIVSPPDKPLIAVQGKNSERAAQSQSLQYFYADAYQFASATGITARLSQHRPQLASSDYHSLAEITAESSDSQQIVEIGWTVDRGVNGDTYPHLFIFHWVNGSPTCYNGCGFVQVSKKHRPGMRVEVTYTPQMYGIKFYNNNWWLGYDNDWFGYFPGSLWNNSYTSLGLAQWFGEVAAGESTPCTDMGDARYGNQNNSAVINNIKFTNGPAASIISGTVTDSAYYNLGHVTATSFSYGGPGAC